MEAEHNVVKVHLVKTSIHCLSSHQHHVLPSSFSRTLQQIPLGHALSMELIEHVNISFSLFLGTTEIAIFIPHMTLEAVTQLYLCASSAKQ